MPTPIEHCVLCGGPASGFGSFAVVRAWRYVRCATCQLVFLDPQPTLRELAYFYNHIYQYDLKRYKNSIQQQGVWLDLLEKYCGHPGTLLEVGCSYGYFLAAARKRGWSAQGVELSETAVEHARKEQGLAAQQGRIFDVETDHAGSFDALVAWHVLEHDPVPKRFVASAYKLLRPGGILALRVPNLASTVAKLSGSCWQWLSPPEHVCMYSQETLSRLLEGSNFEVLDWQTARGNARNMWFEVLRARAKAVISAQRTGRNSDGPQFRFDPPPVYQDRVWYRAVEQLIGIGTVPADWFLSRWMLKHGKEAELVMFARKPFTEIGKRAAIHSKCESITAL